MTEFDREIVRLAERLADVERGSPEADYARSDLLSAVAAKRDAERPKLMTPDQIWTAVVCLHTEDRGRSLILANVMAVIEALPKIDVAVGPLPTPLRPAVYLDAIRAALQPAS